MSHDERTMSEGEPREICGGDDRACCRPGSGAGIDRQAGMDRRAFIKLAGMAAAAGALSPWKAVAGPFDASDFEKLVPADKKLSAEWVRSLFERGSPETYRGPELEKIGMPIGGIASGQLYLGGDGKLWHWDIFNRHVGTGSEHYARPMTPGSPLDQGFALRVSAGGKAQVRPLDRSGWSDIRFRGEYPMALVEYRDPDAPVAVSLEAFSPFVPLDLDSSSFPGTVMRFTVTNVGAERVDAEVAGWLENAVCLHSARERDGIRHNRIVRRPGFTFLASGAEDLPEDRKPPARPDIPFDDFERETYETWTATGTAFGKGPVEKSQVPEYQGDLGMGGKRAVNSHASAPGNDVGAKDAQVGTLTSRPFTIERNFISFLIGGGAHKGKTCVNLVVDGDVVRTATGASENRMRPGNWDVRALAGKIARIQVVDDFTGGWGNIGIDDIVLTDRPRAASGPLERESDFGTMGLALLADDAGGGEADGDSGIAALPADHVPGGVFSEPPGGSETVAGKPFGEKLVGALRRKLSLAPGESRTATFVVAWCFPNLRLSEAHGLVGRHYATRFPSALAAAERIAGDFERLRRETRLWRDTWYGSTLPWWFLDRTFLNASSLATSTSHRLADGRFWGWEGVGCCAGTCGHVWQYAQAVARLYPELERDTRERVDFGLALRPDGAIFFRGEFNNIAAVDGQAGTVLRALREHQMCPDSSWLRQCWPGIKRATEWLIGKDEDDDGLIEKNQHNTLDTDWFGPSAWLSGMYLAALLAADAMATEVGDEEFARRSRAIAKRGVPNLVSRLFDGEYFINRPDPKHPEAINSGTGCHIDQVLGQSWAWQVGLGRLFPRRETVSALRSLWRYNFTPDVGPWRDANKPGRWYAMPGEGGLIMCTFPRADWDYSKARGTGGPDWAAGYFNECMNGFEYQAAGHMIWEGQAEGGAADEGKAQEGKAQDGKAQDGKAQDGKAQDGTNQDDLVEKGLAVTRMIHDRYHPLRRNPYNEIECGDHYARSMASHGVFLAACGYEHHGPRGHLGFAPRLSPEDFRAAFTAAEGWGSYRQKAEAGALEASIEVRWGRLRLRTLGLRLPEGAKGERVRAAVGGREVAATTALDGRRLTVTFAEDLRIAAGERLEVRVG